MAYEDLVTFFTLSERELRSIPRSRDPHNRLGYALQLWTLRFMGFVPDDLSSAPPDAVAFVAHQLAVAPHVLAAYGARAQTRHEHLVAVQTHLGYRKVGRDAVQTLADWLLAQALEHDKPTLLYELTCEKLRTAPLVRPGVTRLEGLGAETRERAQEETLHHLAPLLTDEGQRRLDTLLEPAPARGMTPLAWLRRPAVSTSPQAMVGNLENLTFVRATGVEAWARAALHPHRLTFLAQLARKASAQALQRSPAVRRSPLLGAFLVPCLATVTAEVIEMFARCLAPAYARAGKDLEDFRKAMAQATNETVHLWRELARAVLEPASAAPHLRPAIYTRRTPAVLRRAADEADRLVRPLDESSCDVFETR
jgi:hypothetical protein